MSDLDEDKVPGASTGEGDDTASNPPVDDKADAVSRDTSDTGKPERKEQPKPSAKERLIKELSQPKPQAKEEDDEEEELDDQEDDKDDAEESATPDVKNEQEVDSSKHDTSDRRSRAKQRFEVLTKHNAELKKNLDEAKPFADYGKSMFEYCKNAGLSTEKLGLWLTVAADAEKNPAAAKGHLERLGIKIDPVREVVKEIPTELEDALLDATTKGQLDPEAFKGLLGLIRKTRATQPQVTAPAAQVPAQTHTQPPASTAAPQSFDPAKAAYDRDLAKAVADLDDKDRELATKYPADWPKMKSQIAEAFKRYRGTDPKLWVSFFEDELAKVVAKAKRPAPAAAPLRPSSQTTSTAGKPLTTKQKLVAELVKGK